jgi:hypothetical protein
MSAFVIDPYRFAAFSPSNISGLKLWLDATKGLFDATTGGSAVTTDGSSVARWEDQSGNGNHVTQATSDKRPALKTAIQNGLNVLRFTEAANAATDDFLRASSAIFTGTAARTFFLVAKATSTGQKGFYGMGGGSATGTTFDVTPEIRARVVGRQDFNLSFGTTAFRILTISFPSGGNIGDIDGWLDGVAMTGTPTTVAAINTASTTGFTIGRAAQGGVSECGGDYCEFLGYDQELSTADRESVEQYLADRWDIAI